MSGEYKRALHFYKRSGDKLERGKFFRGKQSEKKRNIRREKVQTDLTIPVPNQSHC